MPLGVLVDGAPMPEEEARAFWKRFSAHLDANRGDLAGFAKAEGFASVHPETRDGEPVLVASRTEPQRSYANAAERASPRSTREAGGSRAPHSGPRPPGRGANPSKKRR